MASDMENATKIHRAKSGSANLRVAAMCLAFVAGMGGLAYASVPLYRIFCQVTGYGGTTQARENSEGIAIVDRDITVRFDSNVSPGLDWKFYPETRSETLKLGEVGEMNFVVENHSDETITGTATFNVTPQNAGAYFNKIACFCFTDTVVKPGEKLEMPVVFFVDPELLDAVETRDIKTITLSYTFFQSDKPEKPLAAVVKPEADSTQATGLNGG
ncbi:MAG: cytochrome c oxidase assembly protein [Nitratireductor sp.]